MKKHEALNKLLYCCDGLKTEYVKNNFGEAQSWIRHISDAYQNYEEVEDEAEACAINMHDELVDALQKVVDDTEIGVVPRSHLDRIEKLLRKAKGES